MKFEVIMARGRVIFDEWIVIEWKRDRISDPYLREILDTAIAIVPVEERVSYQGTTLA